MRLFAESYHFMTFACHNKHSKQLLFLSGSVYKECPDPLLKHVTRAHLPTHIHILTQHTHSHTRTYTHTHTRTHTHIHTHTHTRARVQACPPLPLFLPPFPAPLACPLPSPHQFPHHPLALLLPPPSLRHLPQARSASLHPLHSMCLRETAGTPTTRV